MRTRRTWWTLLAFAALVACQTGGGPPQVLSFTADPPDIVAGGSSTLRWLVTGATTITIAPGVGDVSGTNSTVVTPATTTTYTLTATGAGGSSVTDDVTVTVDTGIDVAGQVLGLDGRPAPSVLVTVLGVGTVPTNFDGSFVLQDVQPPYTIHLRHPTEPLVVTYVGLTIPDPVLIVSGTPPTAQHVASFYGAISGGTNFPQPASHVTRATFASPATRATVDADGTSGAYQIVGLPWFGADVAGALHALQWSYDASNLPVDYIGHGTRPLTLHGATVGYLAQDMALLPVSEGAVSGTTTVPAGYTLFGRTMSVVYDEGGWVVPAAQVYPSTPFSYVTPEIAGASIALAGYAMAPAPGNELSFAVRANLSPTASGVNLVLPEAPTLVSPPDTAVNVGYGTGFSWTTAPGGVTVLLVNGPAGELDYAIVTDDLAASIPDLRDLGLDMAAAAAYTWQVVHLPLYGSVDAAATNADGLLSSWPLNAFFLPAQDGAWANSVIRNFTSIP